MNSSILFSGDDETEPIAVFVENCNAQACEVKRNIPAKMQLTFKASKELSKLEGNVQAQVVGIWIPWLIGSESKVCKNLTKGTCPIPANTEATYGLTITIPGIAPSGTRTIVQVSINDQKNNVIACTRFPVVVA